MVGEKLLVKIVRTPDGKASIESPLVGQGKLAELASILIQTADEIIKAHIAAEERRVVGVTRSIIPH